MIEFVR